MQEAARLRVHRRAATVNAGHARVPARRRRAVLLHRDEHAAAGRAPGDRAGDRRRPGRRAAARSPRGEPLPQTGLAELARPRDRVPDQRRGPRAATSARRRARSTRFRAAARARRPGRHPRLRGLPRAAVLRLAAGQADRLGERPRRRRCAGARRALARARDRGRRDDARRCSLEIIEEPAFRAGRYTTAYLEHARGRLPALDVGDRRSHAACGCAAQWSPTSAIDVDRARRRRDGRGRPPRPPGRIARVLPGRRGRRRVAHGRRAAIRFDVDVAVRLRAAAAGHRRRGARQRRRRTSPR